MKQVASFLTVMILTPVYGYAWQATSTAVDTQKNVKSFELIWKTIRDTHWDDELVGESWANHRKELLPKINAAKTNREARQVMTELIGRLGQSHFGILPKQSYDAISGKKGGNGNVGITARIVNGEVVVTAVRPESAAAKAGVKPGWTVGKIRTRDLAKMIERLSAEVRGPERVETMAGLALERMFSGADRSKVEVTLRNPANETKTFELSCDVPKGRMFKFGHLPSMQVIDETKTLPGNIGYFRFNAFMDPVRIMPSYRQAVRDKNHSNGLVIDLRGNIGGIAAMTMGMASEFVGEQKTLGEMTMKGTSLKFVANPRANPISAPVAVLVDECSISSAEIFAGGLQDLGLAKIFGSRTAGLALPSMVIRLPNGDGFQYAMADYHSASGKSLEKDGVMPDIAVSLTKELLLAEGDPALNAAVDWIKQTKSHQHDAK